MPRSTGTYSPPASSWNPAVDAAPATAADWTTLLADISSALTQSVSADGQTAITSDISLASHKLTSVSNGTLRTDGPNLGQVQDGACHLLTSVSGVDTITASLLTPTLTAYTTGLSVVFISTGANTGAVTININGLGAKAVTKTGAVALVAGDIPPGAAISLVYDGTRFQAVTVTATVTLAGLGALCGVSVVAKSADYTVVAADKGKVINYTSGTYTLTTDAAATLGDGFSFAVRNSGTGIITIDPNASETVDGVASITLAAGESCIVSCNGSLFVTVGRGSSGKQIQPITASVGSNALTLTLNPTSLDFRSTPLTSGTVNTRTVGSAISVVVPSTATLGTVNAQAARLVILAIDNAGTVELAVVNLAGGTNLDETTLISTTTISTGATSASVMYSTTGRSNVPFRVVGFIDITEATAGTWGTAPSAIQGAGGLFSIGVRSMVSLYNANGYGSTNTKIRRFVTTLKNVGGDITYADSATLGATFTTNVDGVYAISYSDDFSSAFGWAGISLNSSQLTTGIDAINAQDRLASFSQGTATSHAPTFVSWTGFLPAGSIIRAHTGGTAATGTLQCFTIARVN